MEYLVYKKERPILLLSGITESGYVCHTEENRAMVFNSQHEAESMINEIPGSNPELWGTRPRRPNKPA